MKKLTRRQQRGSGITYPIIGDATLKLYSRKFRTDLDKRSGRLDVYSKMLNMKELVSWIYFGEGDVVNAVLKSNTSMFTQAGKRLLTNRYTRDWFDKNFISREQFIDFYTNKRIRYCDIIVTYLKQLYILITGSKIGFPERQVNDETDDSLYLCLNQELPIRVTPTEMSRSKLASIFGKDVMERFITNYLDVLDEYKLTLVPLSVRGTINNVAAGNRDAAGNIQNDAAGNIQNDAAGNIQNDAAGNLNDAAGIMGGTRKKRRRRNKSNKRR
jgi:hypothetical protein